MIKNKINLRNPAVWIAFSAILLFVVKSIFVKEPIFIKEHFIQPFIMAIMLLYYSLFPQTIKKPKLYFAVILAVNIPFILFDFFITIINWNEYYYHYEIFSFVAGLLFYLTIALIFFDKGVPLSSSIYRQNSENTFVPYNKGIDWKKPVVWVAISALISDLIYWGFDIFGRSSTISLLNLIFIAFELLPYIVLVLYFCISHKLKSPRIGIVIILGLEILHARYFSLYIFFILLKHFFGAHLTLVKTIIGILPSILINIVLILFVLDKGIPKEASIYREPEKAPDDTEAALLLLMEKLELGIITEDEYKEQRAEIIAKL